MLAALLLAQRRTLRHIHLMISGATIVFGCAMLGLALSQGRAIALLMLTVCGFSMVVQNTGCTTLFQSLLPSHLVGRGMGIYMTMFAGLIPVGSLLMGFMAQEFRTRPTIALAASALVIAGGWSVWRLHRLRSVFYGKLEEQGQL
jgi:hypothetical protein